MTTATEEPSMVAVLRVNTACDLACPFCAFDRRLGGPRPQLSQEDVVAFGRTLIARGGPGAPPLLSFLGGEPFLWKPLLPTAEILRASGARVSVTTNGNLLSDHPEWLTHFDEVTVSLDAPGRLHDELRGEHGLYRRVVALLRDPPAAGGGMGKTLLRVNVVLTEDTIGFFPELLHELYETSIDQITFNLLGGRDRPDYHRDHRVTESSWAFFRIHCMAMGPWLKGKGIDLMASPEYMRRLESRVYGRPHRVHDCDPGRQFLFVNEKGWVSPCAFTEGQGHFSIHDIPAVPPGRQPATQYALSPDGEPWTIEERLPEGFWARFQKESPWFACRDCPSTQVFGKFRPLSYNEDRHEP